MKEENEITREVKELLDSLEQHGANARRQKGLSDLIDSMEAGTGTSLRGAELAERRGNPFLSNVDCHASLRSARNDAKRELLPTNGAKRRKLYPIWWIVGAAAACLLFWLLAKPAMKETPNMDEEILVEEIGVNETIQEKNETIEESVILEESVPKTLLAEETPVKPTIQKPKALKPTSNNIEEPILAEHSTIESTNPEPNDISNIGSSTMPSIEEEKLSTLNSQLSTSSSPQRRVIRSHNLVCYECQKEPENNSKFLILNSQLEKTIFGQPQDPNMKIGSLAFEVKLH